MEAVRLVTFISVTPLFSFLFLGCLIRPYVSALIGVNYINGEEVAIKVESIKAKHPQLEYEARVYKSLAGGGILLYYYSFYY